MTSSPQATRYPTTPCAGGAARSTNEVSAQAVVLGATEVMGPPDPSGERRGQLAAGVRQLLPAQAVEHEQDHLWAPATGSGIQAGGGLLARYRLAQQTGHHPGQARPPKSGRSGCTGAPAPGPASGTCRGQPLRALPYGHSGTP